MSITTVVQGTLVACFAFLLATPPTPALAQQHRPPLLVFPTQNGPDAPEPLRQMCLNPGSWPTGWTRITHFGNSMQYWAQWTDDAEVAQCLANLSNSGKELVIETGVLKPQCQTAQHCYSVVEPVLARLASLGMPQLTLALDEPMTGSIDYADYPYQVSQTAQWIALARSQYPGVKIMLHEAYPYWPAWYLSAFYRDVNAQAIALTGWGIQYASVDHDWNAGGSVGGLIEIQNDAHANGFGFAAVFWDAAPALGWREGLLSQGETYRQYRNNGLWPDFYSILNWNGEPNETLGETAASFGSYANSVRDFVLRFTPTASLDAGEVLWPNQGVVSADDRFGLYYQGDGNLVLYDHGSWQPLWHTSTWGTTPGMVVMQWDGNLVVYDGFGQPVWASGTDGQVGSFLSVQGDGNLVVYRDWDNLPVWASNTPIG